MLHGGAANIDPVGVSLLMKTDFQPSEKVAECPGPFASKVERHPGHSHRSSELAEISRQPTIPWESSLLANTAFQPLKI
jgi:hypothetical protein